MPEGRDPSPVLLTPEHSGKQLDQGWAAAVGTGNGGGRHSSTKWHEVDVADARNNVVLRGGALAGREHRSSRLLLIPPSPLAGVRPWRNMFCSAGPSP